MSRDRRDLSVHHRDLSRLLRWYPESWRARYGEELMALVEDELGDGRPSVRLRLSMARAGLREHGHAVGLLGDGGAPGDRVRGGVIAVFCGWMLFVLAGVSFSKQSEQFDAALAPMSRSLPTVAFDVVWAAGVAAAVLVLAGGLVALPAFRRLLRSGGWGAVRRHVARAAAITAVLMVATKGLSVWARSLSEGQRNGGNVAYEAAFVALALIFAVTLGLWTGAAVAVGKRLGLSRKAVAVEGALGVAVATAMAALTVVASVWWAAMATRAPAFLNQGGTSVDPRMVVTMAIMVVALAPAIFGVSRICRSLPALRLG